ncbi:MAG TPA: LysR substrate-binding domain-containing protein [Xanthomonadales bacterium]|nr:LysR substrate-binding domain-containing protein [Xanthomonadales bacterium]
MSKPDSNKKLAATPPARRSLPPFEALRAFDAVARLGGVRKAANELRRNHAVVSRHLRKLEDWTGTQLVNRTAGGAVLTEEGRRYHKQVAMAIDNIASATIDLMKRGDNSCIDIWCMPGFAVEWLMERLVSYENSNPDIAVALRPTEDVPDFSRQEADIDIRFDPKYGESFQTSAVRAIKLATPSIIPVASPDYLAKASKIEAPADLLAHQLLHEESFNDWDTWLRAHGVEGEFDLSGLRLFNGHLTLDAARRGRGIALTNQFVVTGDLKTGQLIELEGSKTPFEHLSMGSYMFVAKRDRWNVRPIRRFREWLVDEIAKEPPAPH